MPNTRDVPFRVPALEEALARRGKPEIFDTGQGSRFTGAAFAGTLAAGIRVPMDGRGRRKDNVFIARPRRGLKCEDIHLKGYAGGRAARAGIGAWIAFHDTRRPRQALASRTPAAIRRGGITGAPGGKAVDRTPRLANAGALPACPRPRQRRKAA
ncbi:MAG: integrase core domain-containing protein [Methylocella sp.]